MNEQTLMDIKQVVIYLQINEATAYSWAQSGKLPGIKIGRIWRFRREGIEAWLDENMQGPKPGNSLVSSPGSQAQAVESPCLPKQVSMRGIPQPLA